MIGIFLLAVAAIPMSTKVLKHQERLEKEILDSWADGYVEAFFQPVSPSPQQFRLGENHLESDLGLMIDMSRPTVRTER